MFIQPVSQNPNRKVSFDASMLREKSLISYLETLPSSYTKRVITRSLNSFEAVLTARPEPDILKIGAMPIDEAKQVVVTHGICGHDAYDIFEPENLKLEARGRALGFCTNTRYNIVDKIAEDLLKTYKYLIGDY